MEHTNRYSHLISGAGPTDNGTNLNRFCNSVQHQNTQTHTHERENVISRWLSISFTLFLSHSRTHSRVTDGVFAKICKTLSQTNKMKQKKTTPHTQNRLKNIRHYFAELTF